MKRKPSKKSGAKPYRYYRGLVHEDRDPTMFSVSAAIFGNRLEDLIHWHVQFMCQVYAIACNEDERVGGTVTGVTLSQSHDGMNEWKATIDCHTIANREQVMRMFFRKNWQLASDVIRRAKG